MKKEKWIVFRKTMDFVSTLDKSYDPLGKDKLLGDRLNKLMVHFAAIMETLNEKKEALIETYPNRVEKILEGIESMPMVNLGQYTFQ